MASAYPNYPLTCPFPDAIIRELRIACTIAQMEREGGISPRMSPLAQVRFLCDLKFDPNRILFCASYTFLWHQFLRSTFLAFRLWDRTCNHLTARLHHIIALSWYIGVYSVWWWYWVALFKVRDAGNLLTRAGFTLPGVDVDRYTVKYNSGL